MQSSCLLGICLMLLAVFTEIAHPTCVLESDFGFKINCAFKKSGLFRVRNLGGVKAHASIGFSLGDELGFEQSLTNLDPSRRRSVSVKNGAPANVLSSTSRPAKQEKRGKQNRIMRPQPTGHRPNQAAMDKLTSLHRRSSSTMLPIIVQTPIEQIKPTVPAITMAKPMPMGVPPFRPLPPKDDLAVVPIQPTRKAYTPSQVPESKGPGLAYQSELFPQSHNQISKMVSQMTAQQYAPVKFSSSPIIVDPKLQPITTVNPFLPMPSAQGITIVSPPVFKEIHSSQPTYSKPATRPNSVTIQKHPISNFVDPVPHQVHDPVVYNTKKVDDYNTISGYGDDTVLKINKEDINTKIAEIAKAGNISMDAVEAAIALRQQQLLNKYANIPIPTSKPTTTSTTTTEQPFVFQPEPEPEILTSALPQKPKRVPVSGKVMNAPREYYPVGYEKNFDDHFQSKVELPDTNFHCGDQKYFPGLYGDENLGCMVFHVCALTDDGLVMKSFLCPESTLFDQTILKCNWWFYVDCKNTKKLYDTNIPVSKSYQLMKALTFFSSYKKELQEGKKPNPEEVDGIKEAMSILQNPQADTLQPNIANIVNAGNDGTFDDNPNNTQFVTPTPIIDERGHRTTTTESAPVYRGNRNLNTSRNVRSNSTSQKKEDNKLIKVSANINIENNSTEHDSREKIHRRRMILKKNNNQITNTTTTTTTKKPEVSSPLVEIMKQEIKPMEINNLQRQETLTDQIETLNTNTANLAPVRRFYRSSAEKIEEKEMAVVNDEKIQIVRPTSQPRLVGESPTSSSVIEKLDNAILGKVRTKEETLTIVTPIESPKT